MKKIEGDLIAMAQQGRFDVIIHGCNCFNAMHSGIAARIKVAFPEVCQADLETEKGNRAKLGTCISVECAMANHHLIVINAYTQYYRRGPGILVDYDAIRSCFKWIRQKYGSKRIGIPKIGAGLAGGDWSVISGIIEQELDGVDCTLVNYKP